MTTPAAPRRYFVETWGCQMNELDSQRLAGQLMQLGILPTRRPQDADVILLNKTDLLENRAALLKQKPQSTDLR